MEKFKQFGIIPCGTVEPYNSWELSKFDDDWSSRFVVAFIRFNPKEPGFELSSVGMRLAQYGDTEVLRWVFAWTDYQMKKKYLEEE